MALQILAIDPGSDKVGVAVVDAKAGTQEQLILARDELLEYLERVLDHYRIDEIVLGDGTMAYQIEREIELITSLPIIIVSEKSTTEEAEVRYLAEKPMSKWECFLRKFVHWRPRSAVDDYAAVIIAEKYLQNKN